MIKIAVCDDNQDICVDIQKICLDFFTKENIPFVVDTYQSGKALLNAINSLEYFDLIFLDIELGDMTGVTIGLTIRNELKQNSTEIIYISSYVKYALRLFQIQPMDFLIKPIIRDRIFYVLKKFIVQHNILCKTFNFKIGREEKKIPIAEIIYFESLLKEIRIYLVTGKSIQFYGSLKNIRNELSEMNVNYLCPHKSYIVNYRWIKEFHYTYMLMSNDVQIPVGRNNRKSVELFLAEMEDGGW